MARVGEEGREGRDGERHHEPQRHLPRAPGAGHADAVADIVRGPAESGRRDAQGTRGGGRAAAAPAQRLALGEAAAAEHAVHEVVEVVALAKELAQSP